MLWAPNHTKTLQRLSERGACDAVSRHAVGQGGGSWQIATTSLPSAGRPSCLERRKPEGPITCFPSVGLYSGHGHFMGGQLMRCLRQHRDVFLGLSPPTIGASNPPPNFQEDRGGEAPQDHPCRQLTCRQLTWRGSWLRRQKVSYWHKPRLLRINVCYCLLQVNRWRGNFGRSEKCLRASMDN